MRRSDMNKVKVNINMIFPALLFFRQAVFSLSLYELPAIVSNKSFELKKKRLTLQSKKIDIDNQAAEYLPDLYFNFNSSLGADIGKGKFNNGHTMGISSSVALFDGGDRILEHAVEKKEFQNLEFEYSRTYQEELYKNISLFLQAAKQKNICSISAANILPGKMQYEQTLLQKEQGKVSEMEALNVKAEYDEAIYQLTADSNNFESSLLLLKHNLGANNIDINTDDMPISFQPLEYIKLLELYANSKKNGYDDLQGYYYTLEIQKLNKIKAVKDRFIPRTEIDLSADWLDYNYLAEWNKNYFDLACNIKVSWPLFDKNEFADQIKKKGIEMEKTLAELEEKKQERINTLQQFTANFNNEIRLLAGARTRLVSAELFYRMVTESRRLDASSLAEYYQAEKKYRNAQKDCSALEFEIIRLMAEIGAVFYGDAFILFKKENKL